MLETPFTSLQFSTCATFITSAKVEQWHSLFRALLLLQISACTMTELSAKYTLVIQKL